MLYAAAASRRHKSRRQFLGHFDSQDPVFQVLKLAFYGANFVRGKQLWDISIALLSVMDGNIAPHDDLKRSISLRGTTRQGATGGFRPNLIPNSHETREKTYPWHYMKESDISPRHGIYSDCDSGSHVRSTLHDSAVRGRCGLPEHRKSERLSVYAGRLTAPASKPSSQNGRDILHA